MHHTVLVIGENPEEQLVPFDENRDGIIDLEQKLYAERVAKEGEAIASKAPVYMQRMDVFADRLFDYQEEVKAGTCQEASFEHYVYEYYYGEIVFLPKSVHESIPEIYTKVYPEKEGVPNWYGSAGKVRWSLSFSNRFATLDENGKISSVIYYNVPNPKWDWYVLGGRWKNYFKVKPDAFIKMQYERAGQPTQMEWLESTVLGILGNKRVEDPRDKRTQHADQVHKGDVDWEGSREEARIEARREYDAFHAITGGQPFNTYDEILAKAGGHIKLAREMQENDPVDQLIRKSDFLWLDQEELKAMRLTREEFAEHWAQRVITPYGLLHNGVWHEKETWKGGRHNYGYVTRPEGEWVKFVNDLIDSLPDDTLLSLYDYHN